MTTAKDFVRYAPPRQIRPGDTHYTYSERLLKAGCIGMPCTAPDQTFGGRCLNCGWTK